MSFSNDGDATVNHGFMDYWIIKIDKSGNMIWQKSVGGAGSDYAPKVQGTADGGCIVVGSSESVNGDVTGNHGSVDCWVVKLDDKGKLQWQKTLGGTMTDQGSCVQVTTDGGYIVSGSTNSHDGDVTGLHGQGFDAWIIKLDHDGKIQWQKCYGGSSNESARYIQHTPDGGYVFTGSSLSSDGDVSCNAGGYDVLVVKISSVGVLEWQKTLGGTDFDEGYGVQALNDGSFIIAANTSSPNIAGYHSPAGGGFDDKLDYWLIKLSSPVATAKAPIVKIDPASAIVCAGRQGMLTASVQYGGVNPVYQWMKNGMAVGANSFAYTDPGLNDNDLLTCVVKNGNVCENAGLQGSDAVTIHLKNSTLNPEIQIRADNTSACKCTLTTINSLISNGGGSPAYQWMINGNNAGSNAALFSSNHFNNGDVITCAYTDNTSCTSNGYVLSNAIKIGGNVSASSVDVTADKDNVCAGEKITFTAAVSNAGTNPTFQWLLNDVLQQNNSQIYTSDRLANGDRLFCKVIPTAGACSMIAASSAVVVAAIKNSPVIYVSPADTTIKSGKQLQLNSKITGNISSFQWTPSDKLIDPSSLNPLTTKISENTRYTLTAINDQGCKAAATAIINIGTSLYMPNVFTPNNDGLNDLFRIPKSASLVLKEFSVFDRWGNKVFTTSDQTKGWNGISNGKKQSNGIYVYFIKCVINNRDVLERGTLTLVN